MLDYWEGEVAIMLGNSSEKQPFTVRVNRSLNHDYCKHSFSSVPLQKKKKFFLGSSWKQDMIPLVLGKCCRRLSKFSQPVNPSIVDPVF